jgi:hypothetical protein
MDVSTRGASLNPLYLAIALLPAAVFLINQAVLQSYGAPLDVGPARIAAFDSYKEGTARISTLAAFILFIGAATAALLFFGYTLRMLGARARWLMIFAFAGLSAAALLAQHQVTGRNAEDYIGRTLACVALGYDKAQSDLARSTEQAAARPPMAALPADVDVARLQVPRPCPQARFEPLHGLMAVQALAMIMAFSALVFGAICCLAERPGGSVTGSASAAAAAEPGPVAVPGQTPTAPAGAAIPTGAALDLDHWERQSEWLNTYLYLSALLLGTALVFMGALLRWPSYILVQHDAFDAYVGSLLSYYGFTFTVMLAAFYLPVALFLLGKTRASATASGREAKAPKAFKGTVQLLKIVLGLFSTAIAGVLPNILGFIG